MWVCTTAHFPPLNEFWQSYDFFKKNLLYVPENQKAEKKFLTIKKNFWMDFFFLIPVKTFKQDLKEPVNTLSSVLVWT